MKVVIPSDFPGQFGRLAAAPRVPDWSAAGVCYYTSVGGSGSVAAAREIQTDVRKSNVMEYSAAPEDMTCCLPEGWLLFKRAVFTLPRGHHGYKSDHVASTGCNLTHTHQPCPLVIRR
jgi:hypothetical protein